MGSRSRRTWPPQWAPLSPINKAYYINYRYEIYLRPQGRDQFDVSKGRGHEHGRVGSPDDEPNHHGGDGRLRHSNLNRSIGLIAREIFVLPHKTAICSVYTASEVRGVHLLRLKLHVLLV